MSDPLVDEWVEKAEADYDGAHCLNSQCSRPLPDLVCYHCQQSAEKYLKVLLVASGEAPPRIHDLEELANRCEQHNSAVAAIRSDLTTLNAYGVEERYPGMSPDPDGAGDALEAADRVRATMRQVLPLQPCGMPATPS